jgi:hypothetical protein
MTVLSALQSTAIRCVGQKPTSIFSATSGIALELSDLVNEAAKDILKAHDWTGLTKLASLPGDGSTIALSLPDDFDRFPKQVRIFSTQWPALPYRRARDLDEWYFNQKFVYVGTPGWWLINGGKLNVYPAVPSGQSVEFYYICKNGITAANGAAKASFTADDDTFALDERLLTLDCIWRWKCQKGLEYAEHMQNAEIARSKAISDDKGPRILAQGRSRSFPIAYPGRIVNP